MGALLLDMEKAYDSCDHEYIYSMLRAAGFPPNFMKWIKIAFSSSNMRLIINGYLNGMAGGGKQGDPLFPYIFQLL